MTGNLKTEINEFILNAALKKEPVFDSFQKLCDLQNDPNMDYVDFEWKYYQYYHGNRDLAIERSSENSSALTFSDLPIDNLKKVVDKLDLVDCLRLRKASRDLRTLVDCTEIHCEKIKFDFFYRSSGINVGNSSISYCQSSDGGCEVYVNNSPQNTEEYYADQNSRTAMLVDVSAILKSPKLRIGCLEIQNYSEELLEFLKSLNFQLNARSIHFTKFEQNPLPILELLKPTALVEIKLETSAYTMVQIANQFDGLEETSQWKMAKKLYCNIIPEGFPMEKMLHFKEIKIDNFEFSDKNLIAILLKSVHLELCSLKAGWNELNDDFDSREVKRQNINRIMSLHPAFVPETRQIPIPNSQEHFQLTYSNFGCTNNLVIKRTTDKRRVEEFIRDIARREKTRDPRRRRRPVHSCRVFLSYIELCEQERNLLMDYVDFEWKYFKYYHGYWNLTLERSPENSSPVTFSDLPKNVLAKVVGKSRFAERMALREVTRDLRDLVNSTEVHCKTIHFNLVGDGPEIYLESRRLKIAYALRFLNDPSFETDKVEFSGYGRLNVPEFLNLFDFQLNARSVGICVGETDCIPRILQLLKSQTLQFISLNNIRDLTADQFNEIAETEQWKEATKLNCWCFSNAFQMEQMLHFKEIDMKFNNATLVKVRDILLKSTHLERCHLSRDPYQLGENEMILGRSDNVEDGIIDRIMSQDPRFDPKTLQMSIPNSRAYFQLEYYFSNGKCESIRITKISED